MMDLPFIENKEFLKAILNYFQGFITVVNEKHEILFANRALIERTGYDPTGKICYQTFHGLEKRCPQCPLPEVIQQKKIISTEKLSPLDGRWYSMVSCPLVLPSGKTAMLVVVVDIHEQKLAKEKAEKHRAFLETILDRVPMGIVGIQRGGKIVYVNPAFTQILGYEVQEVLGKEIFDFIDPDNLAEAKSCCQEVFCGVIKHQAELYWRHKNGEKRLLQSTCFLVKTPEGEDLVFNISHDITEQKLLQEQFLQAQKMEAVGRLAGGIAHDFNNLLTSLKGYLQLLTLNLQHPEKIASIISSMEKAIDRTSHITQQLLTFSRRRPEEPKIIELGEFFNGLQTFLKSLLGENIELRLKTPQTPLYIQVDESHLQQIIMNLAVNAKDAMPKGGILTIEIYENTEATTFVDRFLLPDQKYAVISVSDTGTGIPPEILPHIFDPFFTTKPPGKGTGLGLATVYSLIKQYEGHIFVDTQEGKGTTFTIFWPAISPKEWPEKETSFTALPTGNETILLVEDDPLVREPVAELLRNLGYQVIEAEDGLEALQKIKEVSKIDLVLTDLVMPRLGGEELAQKLKDRFPQIKVLLASGYPQSGIPTYNRLKGIDFISKPYHLRNLALKIRELLDK